MKMRILMSRPSLTEAESEAVAQVLQSGWLGEGAVGSEFEKAIQQTTGAPYAVAVNSGTAALHLALDALGVKAGDEVILPSFTFAADAMVIRYCGAQPVFADIDPLTLNLDPKQLPALVTPRTKVVMPTDYSGLPADIPAMKRIVNNPAILFVRDACHSFGSLVLGRPVGVNCGEDLTCLSFGPIKNLTCGEGGAVLTNNRELAEKIRVRARLGLEQSSFETLAGQHPIDRRVTQTGYRYHLSNINAAIGLAQHKRFDSIASKKQQVAARYDQLLSSVAEVKVFPRNYEEIVPFLYVIEVEQKRRDSLIRYLMAHGIHAGLRYLPCHLQPQFADPHARLPVTNHMHGRLCCLPIYADLTFDEIDFVVDRIKEYFLESGKQP